MTVVDPTTVDQAPTQQVGGAAASRRQVLCGLMVALVAPGVLAACSSGGSGGTTTTTTPAAGTTGGATGGATTGGSSGASGALSTVSAIPDGGGVLVANPSGGQILLVRSGTTVKAFDPSCPHQGATVDPPQGGVITCPRHNSTFNASTGARTGGPSPSGLKTINVAVQGDNVVLA